MSETVTCILGVILFAAVLTAVYFFIEWVVELVWGVKISQKLQNALLGILILVVVIGMIECVVQGEGHFSLWPRRAG